MWIDSITSFVFIQNYSDGSYRINLGKAKLTRNNFNTLGTTKFTFYFGSDGVTKHFRFSKFLDYGKFSNGSYLIIFGKRIFTRKKRVDK